MPNITIRPYPGEEVVIDGSFTIGVDSPGHVTFRAPTIINSDPDRGDESRPAGTITRQVGLNLLAPDCEIIGGKIIDTGVSIGSWAVAHGTKIYGVLCLNGGFVDDVRWHDHAIYAQNETGERPVKHSIFGPHFGRTLALYGKGDAETEPTIRGYRFDQCVFIERTVDDGGNLLIGGHRDCRLDDIEFTRNHVLGPLQAQYLNTQSGSLIVSDNIFWSRQERPALLVGFWETPTVKGNIINGKSPLDDVVQQEMARWTPPADTGKMVNAWDNNEYHYTGAFEKMYRVALDIDYRYDFEGWQKATGFDASSSFDTKDALPDAVYVYPNEYKDEHDPRCGIIIIWNGAEAKEITVDLSPMALDKAKSYNLVQALDPLGDIVTFQGTDSLIIDMRPENHTVASPIGWPEPLVENPFPRFAAFLVEVNYGGSTLARN